MASSTARVADILLSDLLLDAANPRLPDLIDGYTSQVAIIEAIMKSQGRKLANLAASIVEKGFNPAELPILIPAPGTNHQYLVMEGNRRIAVLKMLSTPDLLPSATAPMIARRFRELSKRFQVDPVTSLSCTIYQTRDEADPWVELRHNGESNGAGVVPWGAREREAFAARRRGKKSPLLQILDFVTEGGQLSAEAIEGLPEINITNLQRLVGTAHVKSKVGITVEKDGTVRTKYPAEEVLKGLTRLVNDVILNLSVNNIRSVEQRHAYIDAFDARDLPDKSKIGSAAHVLGGTPAAPGSAGTASAAASQPPASQSQASSRVQRKSNPPSTKRTTLIPRDCVLTINDKRINNIYDELKRLNIDQFTNAVAVLFRVFLELSLDDFVVKHNIVDVRASLSKKLTHACQYLQDNKLMDIQQLKPVRKIASSNTFLAVGVQGMHEYVHNQYFLPHITDLKVGWDELQNFIERILG